MNAQSSSTITNLPSDHEVESRTRALFKSACENADSYHVLRLGLARRKALNAGPARFASWLWAPLAGGAVACSALAIGLAFLHPFATRQPAPTAGTPVPIVASATGNTEAAVDLDNTQIDLVQNLDFYRWLATQPGSTPATSGGSSR
jgi:hypothetical protein